MSGSQEKSNWFKLTRGEESIEGVKFGESLHLIIRWRSQWISMKLDEDGTNKLIDWLVKSYPGRNENVRKMVRSKLSVLDNLPDSGGDPDPFGG